jgi:hypothetical protein
MSGHRDRAGVLRGGDRVAQGGARLDGAPGAADRRTEVRQRSSVLDVCTTGAQRHAGRAQVLDRRLAAFAQAGRTAGKPDRSRCAEAQRELELLIDELAGEVALPEAQGRPGGLRASGQLEAAPAHGVVGPGEVAPQRLGRRWPAACLRLGRHAPSIPCPADAR